MKSLAFAVAMLMAAAPASAQWTVIDPSNLAQTTATARALMAMADRLPGLDRFRTPTPLPLPIFIPRTVDELVRVAIPPRVYQLMASHVATINQVEDAIARTRARVDNARILDGSMSLGVQNLERTVTSITGARSLTAVMDSVAASEVMARRQAQVDSSLLASLVEFEAIRAQREHDAEIAALRLRAAMTVPRSYTSDTTAWARWRQP